MNTLTNTSKQNIAATTGHSIAPGKSIEVDDDTLARLKGEPYIAGQILRGNLVTGETMDLTRSGISKMSRDEVIGLINDHTDDDELIELDDKNLDELRKVAKNIIFTDL